ncbi:hypothetical protein FGG78_22110, partial [Thioclava sp. BHET1]
MSDEADLLTALISAGLGYCAGQEDPTDLWPLFLAQLARRMQAETATLLLLGGGRLLHSWQSGPPAAMPDPDQLALLRLDRVYSQTDLPGPEMQSTPIRTMRCRTGADGYAVLSLERSREDFRPTVSARLSALAPYLGTTLAHWLRLTRERRQAALSQMLAQQLGAGWMLLTPVGRVTEIDTALRDRLSG